MNIQEAYNKGLDDAENKAIAIFKSVLLGEETEAFLNPKFEGIRIILKERSDYFLGLSKRNNNVGKYFKKRVQEHNETIDKL